MSTQKEQSSALPLRADNHPVNTQERPPASSLIALAVVAVAYLVALAGPSLVVPPGDMNAPVGRIIVAFAITLVGVLIAIVASLMAYRHRRNWSWLVIAIVPSGTLIVCGLILAATKATNAI